jgi:hypothetical protein
LLIRNCTSLAGIVLLSVGSGNAGEDRTKSGLWTDKAFREAHERCLAKAKERFGWVPPIKTEGDADETRKGTDGAGQEKPSGKWSSSCSVTILEALVSPAGEVVEAWPIRKPQDSKACEQSDRARIEAVKKWKYTPVMYEGAAVPSCMMITTHSHRR